MSVHNFQTIINNYISIEKNYKNHILIVLVANVEGKTTINDDYENTSVLSEYYTLDEFETISITYKKLGYEVICFFNEKDFMDAILNNKIVRHNKQILVINSAQTGTYIGRKSLIPAFCEHFKLMHTGSNPYVVSLCRDKSHTSSIIHQFTTYKMKTYIYDIKEKWINGLKPTNGEKVIVKLNGESASIGLTNANIFCYNEKYDDFISCLSQKFNQTIIVQQFISGYEVELPILISQNKTALLPVGISYMNHHFLGDYILDYNSRFDHTYKFYDYSFENPRLATLMQYEALKIATVLGIEGIGRIDFRIDNSDKFYISDIATNPHITEDSSIAYVFKNLGYSYTDMFSCIIGITLAKYYKSLQ